MKQLIFVVGLYFLVKAGLGAFRFVEHFSSYTLDTAYGLGLAVGQFVAPLAFLVVGILLIRYCRPARPSIV